MKVRIEDREAIQALSWESLKAYLDSSKTWKYAEDIPGKAAVYQHKDKSGRLREIIVPLRRDLGDYVSRMADAISTLARVEDRSELDVYEDLSRSGESAAREVQARIRKWLAEEGWHVDDVPIPSERFNLVAVSDDGRAVTILQHGSCPDHITLSLRGFRSGVVQQSIAGLSVSEMHELAWNIYRDVSIMGLECYGLDAPITEMTLRTSVFFDGLTKDVLMQRIYLVNRAYALATRTLLRALEARNRSDDQALSPEVLAKIRHLVPATDEPLTIAS